MSLASRSLHPQISPADGSLDLRYPFGTKPASGGASLSINTTAFAAASIDLTNRRQNTAISINYRTFLQGTSASTATLSVFATAGILAGWTIDLAGNSLTNIATLLGSGSLQVRADDGAGTVVSFPVQSWSITAQALNAIKWAPGWIMELDNGSGGGGLAGWLTQIAALANEPNITTVCYRNYWATLEDAGGGTYVAGFNTIDQLVQACANAGKKFMLAFFPQSYGSTVPASASGVLPHYFETLTCSDGLTPGYAKWPGGAAWAGNLIISAMFWDPIVMGKFIAMTQAYAARYENNPTFILFHGPGETSIGVPLNTRGYTPSALTAQYVRWNVAGRLAWPTTGLRLETNFIATANQALMQQMVDSCAVNRVMCGGPDVKVNSGVSANSTFTGTTGTRDYRGINGFVSEIQTPDFNAFTPTTAMPAIFNWGENGNPAQGGSTRANYYMCWRNTWNGAPRTYPLWDANILPFIRANPVTHTDYPSGW